MKPQYEHQEVEESWTRTWVDQQVYTIREVDPSRAMCIVMPPPNVTGVLHMGHVLNNTIQDVIARYWRLRGKQVCWIPGADHASIATEARVVRWLKEEKGIQTKWDLSREEFLRYAWQWKEKHERIIREQLVRLGVSVDWSRFTFTMDSHYSRAVVEVFVRLYRDGWIYRGERMIHWDPVARTALSDEEVLYREVEGALYYVRYPLAGDGSGSSDEYLVIATTRPETILADTAVAVHPDDDRYRRWIGRQVRVPLTHRTVPVIGDTRVDPAFGTGVLKVTPAHDFTDFEIGRDHGLPAISILDESGRMTPEAGPFAGLSREEARKRVVEALQEQGLLERVEKIRHHVGFSERTDVPVEPRLSRQWFVRMRYLADLAKEAVQSGAIRFVPERFLSTYFAWLENVKDWCISRQLWWGHRIPAWYLRSPEPPEKEEVVFVARTAEEAYQQAYEKLGTRNVRLEQDPDVLDTWFSSWLWPLQTLRFFDQPDNPDFQTFYPTYVLVTGPDILFFWVARMIMAGKYFAGKEPFRYVYLHGIIRDRYRRKMSKSLGNSPDVLQLMETYGADALRCGVLMSAPAGNDLLFDEKLCETGRNFLNKLWNAFRLLHSFQVAHSETTGSAEQDNVIQALIQWMDWRTALLADQVHQALQEFRISEALKLLYSFVWDEFTSLYLEAVKRLAGAERTLPPSVHTKVWEHTRALLMLLHPFVPMITEELWQKFPETPKKLLSLSTLDDSLQNPEYPDDFPEVAEWLLALVPILRRIFREEKLPESPVWFIIPDGLDALPSLGAVWKWIVLVLPDSPPLSVFRWQESFPREGGVTGVYRVGRVLVGFSHRNPEAFRTTLEKERERLRTLLSRTMARLENPRFREKAPRDVVSAEEKKLRSLKKQLEGVEESLRLLKVHT